MWDRLANHSRYLQDSLSVMIQQEALNELRMERIPIFYLDANVQRNLIIPTTPVPAIAFDPSATEGAIIPLKFATKWSSRAGVHMEWQIFDPGRKSRNKEGDLLVKKAELEQVEQLQKLRFEATLAYTGVVLATKQYQKAVQDSLAYQEIVSVYESRYALGRAKQSDYFIALQEFERKKIQVQESLAVMLEADLELRRYVDLAEVVSLSSDLPAIIQHVEENQQIHFDARKLDIDRHIIDEQTRGLKQTLLPTLSINAYLGQQYFGNTFRIDRAREWYGNSFVNLALNLPLSAHFTVRPSLRKSLLSEARLRNEIQQQQLEDQIADDQTTVKVKAARYKVASLKKIEQLALEDKNSKEAAYKEGRLLLAAYNESLVAYHKCVQDVWQAEYDLVRISLDI